MGNPVFFVDPLGLVVQRCCRNVEVNQFVNTISRIFGLQHCFLKTDAVEAGMGPANNGPLPACPFGVETAVVNHAGQSTEPGTHCVVVPDVDEGCVNQLLEIGRPTGRWSPINQCNSFADDVVARCRPECPIKVPPFKPCQTFGCLGTEAIEYCYDRFDRTTKDVELTYLYDANGNRTGIGYPGNVSATYRFDFADREVSLSVTSPGRTEPVVSAASYLPSGPLSSLALGSGVTETRGFDGRYVPVSIAVSGPVEKTFTYTTDPVANVLEIVEQGACTPGPVVLENQTITTPETFTSCTTIETGNGFSVEGPGGDVTFQAQGTIALKSGFAVGAGALEVDPARWRGACGAPRGRAASAWEGPDRGRHGRCGKAAEARGGARSRDPWRVRRGPGRGGVVRGAAC